MNPKASDVLLISGDRSLLRHVSRLLELFGYDVVAAADAQQARAAAHARNPNLVIVDRDLPNANGVAFCRSLRSGRSESRDAYVLLLSNEPTASELIQALEAGVDDFLCKPLVYGELLARLQAGIRIAESQRRFGGQRHVDPLTGLLSKSASIEKLRDAIAVSNREGVPLSCVMIGVDFFDSVQTTAGRDAADAILRGVAQRLKGMCTDRTWCARVADDRFCVVMPGVSDVQCRGWSEKARGLLAEMEVESPGGVLTITASLGVAGRTPDIESPEELLERADDALQAAMRSGRNCVVRSGELADEVREFHAIAAPDKLFEGTLARDVMVPCALRLSENVLLDEVCDLLSNSDDTQVPVVDDEGRFAGLISRSACDAVGARGRKSSRRVGEMADRNVACYDEESAFGTLFDFFIRDGRSEVVVTHRGEPMGIVARDELAGLIEPRPGERGGESSPVSAGQASTAGAGSVN